MGRMIGGRLVHLAWIMVAVSFLTFLLMYLAPGDAAAKKLNAQGIAVSERRFWSRRGRAWDSTGRFSSSTATGRCGRCGAIWASPTRTAFPWRTSWSGRWAARRC